MKNGHALCLLRNENFGQAGDGRGADGMEYDGVGQKKQDDLIWTEVK